MSLLGTLAKVAIGVAVAKGVGSMMQKPGGGGTLPRGADDIFGGGASGQTRLPGGLENMMGEILGGRQVSGTSRSDAGGTAGLPGGGGLGDLLESLGGGKSGGGLGDLIGQLGRGSGSGGGSGGLGDLLGGLLGGAVAGGAGAASRGGAGGSFGDLLNQALGNRGEPQAQPTREQDAVAGLMLRAMIQAAKSDGRIDAVEKQKLLGNLGDVSAAEQQFVQQELEASIDIQGLVRQVPQGLEQQVYVMSVMAIDLDHQNEANYLAQLAEALNLDQRQVNALHAQLGVPALYS